jgi:hypothetical protein
VMGGRAGVNGDLVAAPEGLEGDIPSRIVSMPGNIWNLASTGVELESRSLNGSGEGQT